VPPITLMHVGYRWYDPALGRFIQRDPMGLAAGLNVYAYCEADPVAGIDPDGTWNDEAWESYFKRRDQNILAGGERARVQGELDAALGTVGVVGLCIVCPAGGGASRVGGLLGPRGPIFGRGAWLNTGKCRIGWSWKAKEGWKFSFRWKNWHWDWW